MAEKYYPRDERALVDAGEPLRPKPCAKRIDRYITVTWCHLPEDHYGDCSGPEPRALEHNDFMPRRR